MSSSYQGSIRPKPIRPLASGDVVRVETIALSNLRTTGVINRIDGEMANVFLKGQSIGIWFALKKLKRIGRVKVKP